MQPVWMFHMTCRKVQKDFALEGAYGKVFEGDAVLAALRLAERGILNRIRLCATCSHTWLFARHRNYKFCSQKCREGFYMNTNEYRARKARQMREYRARLSRQHEAEKRVFSG